MPRVAEMKELTPFAAVLVDYMWNRRRPNQRPLTTSQLAVRLGVPRQSVNNWIYSGNVPPLEAVFAVLAKLDIPMRALFDAYRLSGLPVPRWDEGDAHGPYDDQAGRTFAEHTRKPTTFPIEDISALSALSANATAPEPMPYTPHTPAPVRDVARESAEEWDNVIAQTAKSLRDAGMSQRAVDGAIAALRARQSGALPEQPNTSANTSTRQSEQPQEQPQETKQRQQKPQHTSGKSR